MAAGGGDAVIVRSTVQLGRSLGLRVVAEGVEDAGVLGRAAARSAASIAQGYHLSRPQPRPLLTPWLRTAASTSATGGLSAELTA